MGSSNPVQTISFQYSPTNALSFPAVPCIDQCSCQNCNPGTLHFVSHLISSSPTTSACPTPPDLGLNTTKCLVKAFGGTWECLAMSLVICYIGLTIIGLVGIAIGFYIYKFRTNKHGSYADYAPVNVSAPNTANAPYEFQGTTGEYPSCPTL